MPTALPGLALGTNISGRRDFLSTSVHVTQTHAESALLPLPPPRVAGEPHPYEVGLLGHQGGRGVEVVVEQVPEMMVVEDHSMHTT